LREALIRATRELVEQRGAENFTRHFSGKQEIPAKITTRVFEELGNRTTAILAEKGEGTLEAIIAMGQAYIAFAVEETPCSA
jgi:hypothetical protein